MPKTIYDAKSFILSWSAEFGWGAKKFRFFRGCFVILWEGDCNIVANLAHFSRNGTISVCNGEHMSRDSTAGPEAGKAILTWGVGAWGGLKRVERSVAVWPDAKAECTSSRRDDNSSFIWFRSCLTWRYRERLYSINWRTYCKKV